MSGPKACRSDAESTDDATPKPPPKRDRAKDDERAIGTLVPGIEVRLQCGAVATVYPAGFMHVRRFSEMISEMMALTAQALSRGVQPGTQISGAWLLGAFAQVNLPRFMRDGLELVGACTSFSPPTIGINDLPHWDVPPLIEAWVRVNFEDEARLRPWAALIDTALTARTGKPFSISATLSRFWSGPDSTSEKSSTTDSPGGPTEGGAGDSSASGPSASPAGTEGSEPTPSPTSTGP